MKTWRNKQTIPLEWSLQAQLWQSEGCPTAYSSSSKLTGVEPPCSPEGSRMSSRQPERSDCGETRSESRVVKHRFLYSVDQQPFWTCRSAQLSLRPGFVSNKDTCVLTHPLLPLPSLHTLSCCSLPVSLDLTPRTRQPLSGWGRAEWASLLAPAWFVFACACRSKLRATSASTMQLVQTWVIIKSSHWHQQEMRSRGAHRDPFLLMKKAFFLHVAYSSLSVAAQTQHRTTIISAWSLEFKPKQKGNTSPAPFFSTSVQSVGSWTV